MRTEQNRVVPHATHRSLLPTDRRDVPARKALLRRVRSEFGEMPGLNLSLPQAALLFGLPLDTCASVLHVLTEERFLRQAANGQFVMRSMSPDR